MSPSRDTLGLVTFGRSGYISRPGYNSGIRLSEINNVYSPYSWTYSDYATVDRTLIGGISGFNSVKNNISSILPDHGTPMRSAIYKSIEEIKSRGRVGSVKAIILLSDGDYNWYGDPLARGTASTNGATTFGDLTTSYKTFTGLGSGQFSNQNMSVYATNNSIKDLFDCILQQYFFWREEYARKAGKCYRREVTTRHLLQIFLMFIPRLPVI